MYCPLHSPWPFFSIRSAHASYSTNALLHAVVLEHFSSIAIFGSTGSSSSSTSAGTIVRWSDIASEASRAAQMSSPNLSLFSATKQQQVGAAQKAFCAAIIAL